MARIRVFFHGVAISAVCIIVSTYTLYNPSVLPFSEWKTAVEPYPTDTTDNLLWFVQISDIHVSRYYDPQRAPDLKEFCNSTLGIINPDVVLVTGDLTDAKSRNKYDSQQYIDEWQTYQSVLEETKVTKKVVWLDIRGNHDAFDVPHVSDPNSNLYLKYSGDKGRLTSQVYHLKKPYGKYSFIPVDATMVPGPRRPFNFVGYLTKERMLKLERFQKEASESNYTIWYSHYPTSSITSHDPGIRRLVGQTGGVYVAGHLHTLGGLTHTMYAMNSNGFLELELADWKYERAYRIMAVDHDLMSFTDLSHKQWPAVVLTNPKDAKFMMPHIEPIRRIRESTHIRFLIFNPWKIQQVLVSIDGVLLLDTPHQVSPKSPLWVCRWEPKLYLTGTHSINITVTDLERHTKVLSQEFSLDATWSLNFGYFAPFVLLTDFSTLFLIGFYLMSFGYICGIIFLRFYYNSKSAHIVVKMSILLKDNSTFYGVLLFALNLMWGPWFAGSLLRESFGICFPFGMLINGEIVPEHMLYVNGMQKVALFYLPAIFFLAHFNYAPDKKSENNLQKHFRMPPHSLLLAYIIFIVMHIHSLWGLYESYGLMAAIISPFELWWTCFIMFKVCRIYVREPILVKS